MAVSFGQRLKGLLGKKGLLPNEAMVLKPCNSIHTFFMRFDIDALFLNSQMKVIKIVHEMGPNRLTPIIWNSHMVIELPSGKANQSNTCVGDIIELK